MTEQQFYTVPAVAHLFQVSTYTIREWLKDEENPLKGVKLPNGQWRIPQDNLQEMLNKTFGA